MATALHENGPIPPASGFTLIEMSVAIAIVAILSGLGAVSFGGVAAKSRVTGEANDLLIAVEVARAEATKRGRRVTVLPAGGDWTAGWTVFADLNGNRQVDPGEPVILSHPPMKSTTRITTNTTPGYLAFGASGMPQQYNGGFLAATLALCDGGNGKSIVIAKSGRPRLTTQAC